jgi:stage IV sporulation protein FB
MENEFESFYPPKPYLEKEQQRQGHVAVTVFSIVLFAIAFLFFFGQQVVFLVELIAILLLHELGHFVMMKRFGYRNVRMLFVPLMGAFVHGSKETYRQKESILVILAGPLPGIAIGVALLLAGIEWRSVWMIDTAFLSFALNVINLLPILPLDGGRLLNVLFFQRMELFQLIFSLCSSLAMIVLGFLIGFYGGSYILMIFGFLMGLQVRGMHRRYLVHRSLRDSNVEYMTTYENLTDRAYHFIRKEVLEHTPGLRRFLEQSESGEEDASRIVAGEVNNMLEAPQEKDAGVFYRIFILLVWIAAIVGPVLMVLNVNLPEEYGI